jgi:succinate dehydrogenase / fumarate reductase cytochrome b subunit
MNLVRLLCCSSIGRKILMAATGLILVGFATGHMVGNLQIFAHPDKINGYAHFLQSMGPLLWAVRLVLLACAVVHVWAAVALVLENRTARGPEPYGVSKWLNAAFSSRYMKHTGVVVLAFLVYHLAHFTVGTAQAGSFKAALPEYVMKGEFHLMGIPVVAKGLPVHDVYSMVFLGFANPAVSVFYLIAIALLTLHLLHGIDSMFQTLGLRNHRWVVGLRRLVVLYCLVYLLGNFAVPGAILTGAVKPAAGTAAAGKIAAVAVPGSPIVQR